MANNIFQNQITPVKPKVLESERIYVYVPTATKDIQGIASYNNRDFGVNNGHVSLMWPKQMLVEQLSNPLTQVSNIKVLADEFVNTNNVASITNPITGVTYNSNTAEVMLNRRNRNAFVRPDFVMLDNIKDFESSTDENDFVKYTLKRNNPLEQPSLIQISTKDFIRENGIVKINWTNIEKAVTDLETKINKVINTEIQIVDANGNFVAGNGTIGEVTSNSIVIGPSAKAALGGSIALLGEAWDFVPVAIGSSSEAGNHGVAIGASAKATQFKSLALGAMAEATAGQAVQLGQGTNNEYGTLQFRSFKIIDKDGKVYTNTGTQAAITMKLVATEEYVNNLFNSIQNVTLQIVDTLPITGQTNIIYLVPVTDGKEDNYYKEYIYIENKWELIGTTKVDLTNYYTKDEIQNLLLNSYKPIMLGGDGVAEDNVYNFIIDNANSYIDYRTNGTKFLVDLLLPIVGDLDKSRRVAITFGDTVYYIYNILGGNEPATIGDLIQITSYNNATGYRFISEMLFFDTGDIKGFAILPTNSVSDILSLDSDQMDNYMADGGLTQGQLAICNKVITNGYVEGGLYRFDITYPDTYTWTELSSSGVSQEDFDKLVNNEITLNVKASNNSFKQGNALGVDSYGIAIGKMAYGGEKSIAIGSGTGVSSNTQTTRNSIAVGYLAQALDNGVSIGYNAQGRENNAVVIGKDAGGGLNSVVIGINASADGYDNCVLLGNYARSNANNTIQLGTGTNTKDKSLQIWGDNIYNGNTHTLTVQNIELNGEDITNILPTIEDIPDDEEV